MKGGFYSGAFKKKIYKSTEKLQADADLWLVQYNTERTHSRQCYFARTPMQTLIDSLQGFHEELLDRFAGSSERKGKAD